MLLGKKVKRAHTPEDMKGSIYLCNSVDIIHEIPLELINQFSKFLVGLSRYTH